MKEKHNIKINRLFYILRNDDVLIPTRYHKFKCIQMPTSEKNRETFILFKLQFVNNTKRYAAFLEQIKTVSRTKAAILAMDIHFTFPSLRFSC